MPKWNTVFKHLKVQLRNPFTIFCSEDVSTCELDPNGVSEPSSTAEDLFEHLALENSLERVCIPMLITIQPG